MIYFFENRMSLFSRSSFRLFSRSDFPLIGTNKYLKKDLDNHVVQIEEPVNISSIC